MLNRGGRAGVVRRFGFGVVTFDEIIRLEGPVVSVDTEIPAGVGFCGRLVCR